MWGVGCRVRRVGGDWPERLGIIQWTRAATRGVATTPYTLNSNWVREARPEILHPVFADRYRANMAHIRQSRPYSGLGLQVKVLKPL